MMNKTNTGRRVELVHSSDPYTQLRAGSQGTVKYQRYDGFSNTTSIAWDDGSTLMMIEGEDHFKFLD